MCDPRRALALVALLAALLAGCAGAPAAADEAPPPPLALDPSFAPAFDALSKALEAGEDELARHMIGVIRARGPSAELEQVLQSFERVLDGRELVRALQLALKSEPVAGSAGDYRLVLEARHDKDGEVTLRMPPALLLHTVVRIDAGGSETRRVATQTTRAFDELCVKPGELVRVPLVDYELALEGGLAVRERWTAELRSGEVELAGRALPARTPPVDASERTRVAPFLPAAPVEPEELARYVRQEKVFLPPLLERAVRIAPERRAEALDRLAPEVASLAHEDPARVEEIAPALRWLARTDRPGGDCAAWAAWFEARSAAQEKDERDALDLPGEPAQ